LPLSKFFIAHSVLFACFSGVFVPFSFGAQQPQKRIKANLDDSETFVLKGNTRPVVALRLAQDGGPVDDAQVMPRMSLHFTLTAPQRSDLTQLLTDQQNRRSATYRKFLTPEQYASRFGLNTADLEKVTVWLENSGFTNIQAARGGTSISFTGSAARVAAAFHTAIHSYTVNGVAHIANATDPQLPKALSGMVESVRGLHDMLAKPRFTASSGTTYLVPDDWETIYDVKPLYGSGLDGSPISGQTYSLAVVGQSDVQLSDLHAFRTAAGLGVKDPTVVIPPGDADPGLQSPSGDQGESDLDLEWAGAIAKNANILFVTADSKPDNGVQDAIAYAINNNVAPILSTSYGQCEADLTPAEFNTQNTLFQQAAAQGMTVIAAAGDHGAADCDTGSVATKGLAVDFPASSQYVTGVGGTEFNTGGTSYFGSNNSAGGSAVSYIPEIAWNDGNLAATGGGASRLVAKPSWQTGAGVPSDGQRDVPDIAFAASTKTNGLLFCNNGSCSNGFLNSSSGVTVTGTTSAGPPTFSGVLALLVQKTGARLGLLNSNLYSLAAISGNAFHDVTAGNNQVACQGGSTNCPATASTATGTIGYSAGVGYDQTTGWGSIDSYNFVEQWSGDIQLAASPSTLNITPGSSAISTITVTPVKNFSGPVSFKCSVASSLVNVTCSVPSTVVTTSGSTTVTITAANLAAAPFWRKLPTMPPVNPAWLLLALVLGAAAYAVRKQSLYTLGAAGFAVLTLGAVSCGSGSATGAISLTCVLPNAQVAIAYTGGSCVATGGAAPYTYSLETPANGGTGTGLMPPGLTLNTSTGAITGTPTLEGNTPFSIIATDSASKTLTQNHNLTVGPAPIENGLVTITATSGAIVNTTTILVSTSL
jgi:subtilase family serine protease